MLAFAYDVSDVAEYEEITGDRPRQTRDIADLASYKTGCKLVGDVARRLCLCNRSIDALRDVRRQRNVERLREFDKACGQIGVTSRDRGVDLPGDVRRARSRRGAQLDVAQRHRVVPRREDSGAVARMRPDQHSCRHKAEA